MESDKKKITYHFPKAKFKNEFFFESSSEKPLLTCGLLLFYFADFQRAVADREFERNTAISGFCRD